MTTDQQELAESLIVDKDGKRYASAKTFMLLFHESKASAYRRINRDFKDKKSVFHSSFKHDLRVPGQRATTSGITLGGFYNYKSAIEYAEQEDDAFVADIQETKDLVNKDALKNEKTVSNEYLIGMINFMEKSDGQVISNLQAEVTNTAIVKKTNPFTGESAFVAGKTYDEFLIWSKDNQVIR